MYADIAATVHYYSTPQIKQLYMAWLAVVVGVRFSVWGEGVWATAIFHVYGSSYTNHSIPCALLRCTTQLL